MGGTRSEFVWNSILVLGFRKDMRLKCVSPETGALRVRP
jgi:hypothetical protein